MNWELGEPSSQAPDCLKTTPELSVVQSDVWLPSAKKVKVNMSIEDKLKAARKNLYLAGSNETN